MTIIYLNFEFIFCVNLYFSECLFRSVKWTSVIHFVLSSTISQQGIKFYGKNFGIRQYIESFRHLTDLEFFRCKVCDKIFKHAQTYSIAIIHIRTHYVELADVGGNAVELLEVHFTSDTHS